MFQGKTLQLHSLTDGLVELRFDAEDMSVNVFNKATVEALSQALDQLEAMPDVKGLLVTSGKKLFIAGADITEFRPAFAGGKEAVKAHLALNNRNFNRLESLPFPTVALINGVALGGGFEVCLACDFRVCASTASVGFPEVGLGIIPGWGGTVRAPRITSLDVAAEWVCGGKPNRAKNALAAGLVDEVCELDELREKAMALIAQTTDTGSWQQRRQIKTAPLALPADQLSALAVGIKQTVAAKAGPHYPAPVVAAEVMLDAATLSRDEALDREFDAFYNVAMTSQARALIGNFLSDQKLAAVTKQYAAKADAQVNKIAVLGAGVMGGGIAYQNASRGIPVVMKDIQQQALDLGISEVNRLLQGQVKKGRLTPEKAAATLALITPTLDYQGFGECDMVIEAVVEKEVVKKAVLSEVESSVSEDTVLASNTSSILITSIATALSRPENFCGLHFFNPVHAMPLVEVVVGEKTSENTVAKAAAHVMAMGKKGVVVKDCPGFLVNRVLFPYLAGFNLLMREGADYRQIDHVMETWGWPMGPAYLLDVIGIDVAVHAGDVVADGFPDRLKLDFESVTHRMASLNRYGQKSGMGFYRYQDMGKGRKEKVEDPQTTELLKDIVAAPAVFSEEDIVARMMIPMCTELARCLEEGIVGTPEEADISLVYGIGFPPFRGGVFRWLDEIGLDAFAAMTENFHHLGPLYQLTEGMKVRLANGSRYYS